MIESIHNLDDVLEIEELEELLDHAEETLAAVILSTVAYTKERQLSLSDWVGYVGAKVAPTWDHLEAQAPLDVARIVAINLVATGGEVHELSGDDERAELRCTWPAAEELDFFGLDRGDVDPFFDAYGPIAAHLDLTYRQRRDGDVVVMEFAR